MRINALFCAAVLAGLLLPWGLPAQGIDVTVCDTANVSAQSLTCAFGVSPLSLVPLTAGQLYISETDPSQTPYETFLYPGASNDMPPSHRAAGEALAASIQPLDANGNVDIENGKIAVVVEGFSNPFHEMNHFIQYYLQNNPAVNPKVTMVNKSIRGCPLNCWYKKGVDSVDYQVQIVIMKHSNNTPQNADGSPRFPDEPFTNAASKRFPRHALLSKEMLKIRILDVKKKYPNLKLLFLTSRAYGGWTCAPASIGYGEPVAFEEGFSVKWLIEDQILARDPDLQFSGPNAKAPWMAWGPYLWDPTWTQDMFVDGVHPCTPGLEIVARKWYDFLMQDALGWLWFRDNESPSDPQSVAATPAGTNRIDLSWQSASDNSGFIRYNIFRNGFFLARTLNTFWSDTTVAPGQTYCYTITAVDSAGNESNQSEQVCATTLSTALGETAYQPAAFHLAQNYPNPFNPETEIAYDLPRKSQVLLRIFSTVGVEVRTLVQDNQGPGQYRIRWDGTNQWQQPVPSGIYIYRLEAYAAETDWPRLLYSKARRMVILR